MNSPFSPLSFALPIWVICSWGYRKLSVISGVWVRQLHMLISTQEGYKNGALWNYSELNAGANIVVFLNKTSGSHRRDAKMRGRHSYIFKHERHQILRDRRKYNYIKEWICLVLCSQTVETADQMTYILHSYLMLFFSQKVYFFTVQIISGEGGWYLLKHYNTRQIFMVLQ